MNEEPIEARAIPLALPVKPTSVRGVDLLIGVGIVWAAELLTGVAIGVVLVASGAVSQGDDTLDMSPALLLVSALMSAGFGVCVSWYFVCRKYRLSSRIGFAFSRIGIKTTCLSVLMGIVGAALAAVLLDRYSTGESFMAEVTSTRDGLIVVCLIALILPPFEEIYYRGFIFPVLRKKLGPVWAIIIVTCWFGAAHGFQLAGDWVGLGVVAGMGCIWTLQRHLTGSLVPSIVTHWVYNATLVISSLVILQEGV